jgi:hypothetical protein
MKIVLVILGVMGLMLAGCEKKEGEATAETPKADEAKPETTTPAEPAKPAAGEEKPDTPAGEGEGKAVAQAEPAKPGPEVAQCQKILDAGWKAIQPALERLGIEDPASQEADYKDSAKAFLEGCQALPQEHRDCLEKAEHPLLAIGTCKVNEGKKTAEKLFAPSVARHIKIFDHPALDEKKAKKMLASLKGRWVNKWKKANQTKTWVVNKKGEVKQTFKFGKKDPEEKQFSVLFEKEGRMKVVWNESSSQDFTYLRAGKKVFYAQGNLAYDFYPMKSKKSFVVRNSGDYIFFDKGKCVAVSDRALMVDAKCKWAKKKGKKVLNVSYQFPGRTMMNDKPLVNERTFHLVGKNLLHESLMESSKYVRK